MLWVYGHYKIINIVHSFSAGIEFRRQNLTSLDVVFRRQITVYITHSEHGHFNICLYIALRRFLHNHGNIATEGIPKPGLCPTLFSNDFKGSL